MLLLPGCLATTILTALSARCQCNLQRSGVRTVRTFWVWRLLASLRRDVRWCSLAQQLCALFFYPLHHCRRFSLQKSCGERHGHTSPLAECFFTLRLQLKPSAIPATHVLTDDDLWDAAPDEYKCPLEMCLLTEDPGAGQRWFHV